LGLTSRGFWVKSEGKQHRIIVFPLCPEPGALPG
jgi:hypothetical protein